MREIGEGLRHLTHELGDGRRRRGTSRCRGRPLLRPPLGANERHEAHAAEVLVLEAAIASARHAHELLRLGRADRDHQPAARCELRE